MATLDSLQSQLNALESKVSGIQSGVDSQATSIHNLQVTVTSHGQRITSAEKLLKEHSETLKEHARILADHERRLKLIEEDYQDFAVIPYYKNYEQMMLPDFDKENKRINLYMPPFTKEELREYNPDIPGLVEYKWYQKIFNPSHIQGNVTFDFDDSREFLKSISLGPSSKLTFPIPLLFHTDQPNRKLVVESLIPELVCVQQFFGYEKENIITLFNFTNCTINIQFGKPILGLNPVYGYSDSTFKQIDF